MVDKDVQEVSRGHSGTGMGDTMTEPSLGGSDWKKKTSVIQSNNNRKKKVECSTNKSKKTSGMSSLDADGGVCSGSWSRRLRMRKPSGDPESVSHGLPSKPPWFASNKGSEKGALSSSSKGILVTQIVRLALSIFNEESRAKKEPEYELVKVLEYITFPCLNPVYHSNFIARPENGSECEDKLFFAEVRGEINGVRVDYTHTFCCILGPSDTTIEAGPSGCYSCDRRPGNVQHPLSIDGEYDEEDEEWLGRVPRVQAPRVQLRYGRSRHNVFPPRVFRDEEDDEEDEEWLGPRAPRVQLLYGRLRQNVFPPVFRPVSRGVLMSSISSSAPAIRTDIQKEAGSDLDCAKMPKVRKVEGSDLDCAEDAEGAEGGGVEQS